MAQGTSKDPDQPAYICSLECAVDDTSWQINNLHANVANSMTWTDGLTLAHPNHEGKSCRKFA